MTLTNFPTIPRWDRLPLLALLCAMAAGCSGDDRAQQAPISEHMLALSSRGLAELENERPEQAEAQFAELLELLPDDPLPRTNLAIAQLRQQRLEQAEQTLAPLLADAPTARSLALAASIAQQRGDLSLALQRLQQALSIPAADGEIAFAAYNLASQMRGADAEALTASALRQLTVLRPDNPWVALKRLQYALSEDDRSAASGAYLRLRELAWRFEAPAVALLTALEGALNAGDLGAARGDALRLENLLRASALYREALAELRVGILGVPLERFAAPLPNPDQGTDVPLLWATSDWPEHGAEAAVLALQTGDLDQDGRADVAVVSAGIEHPQLHWQLSSRQFNASGGLSLSGYSTVDGLNLSLIDLDNDDHLDAVLWGPDGSMVIAGRGADGFTLDESEAQRGFGPSAQLVAFDFDLEGDLDVIRVDTGGRLALHRNNLSAFQVVTGNALVGLPETFTGVRQLLVSDLDRDVDLDVLLLHQAGVARLHNRRYGELVLEAAAIDGLPEATAMATADMDNDGWIDLLLADQAQIWIIPNREGVLAVADSRSYPHGAGSARALRVADFDNDGDRDVVVAGDAGVAVSQQLNDGSLQPGTPLAGTAVAVADLDGDGLLDLLLGAATGLTLQRNQIEVENGWLTLRLKGLTDGNSKNNSFGIGAAVELRNGADYQRLEVDRDLMHIGLGAHDAAEQLRVLWTNGVPQNRLDLSGRQSIVEEQVLKGSCPFLYAWDGERYVFVTDLLWAAPLGLPVAPGIWLPADPSELVRVDGLVADQGLYRLQITEELWEAAFFDHLRLWVVDHPVDVEVASSLRIVPGQSVPDQIYASARLQPLAAASDGHGRDATAAVAERDEIYAAGYTPSAYQGVAAEPWTFTIDLGRAPSGPLRLHLDGWVFPADASLNLAVAQRADLPYLPPSIEVETDAGWKPLLNNAGFPAGKTKAMVIELPALPAGSQRLRIVSNLWLHWDQIRWSEHPAEGSITIRERLLPTRATLSERGYSKLLRRAPNAPHSYDYASVSTQAPWLPLPGRYTRLGDVLPLLQQADDFSVILAAGDQLSVSFDARALGEPDAGMRRTLFLESHGWDKDADLNTYSAQTLEPLPFRAMSGYPWGADEHYPDTPAHRDYRAQWLTRELP